MYKTKKIIVIDNDIVNRNFVVNCLQVEGYDTIDAKNGIVGLELIKKYVPDLVIYDLVMPDMDGYTVLQQFEIKPATRMVKL